MRSSGDVDVLHTVNFNLYGFLLERVEGLWMPYGGMKKCPDRQLAKQEILLSTFDIELCGTNPSALIVDMKYYGLGTLLPKGKAAWPIDSDA